MIDVALKEKIDALTSKEKDDIYRYLWHQHVKEDVESHAIDMDVELDEDEIDIVAEWYVYDGDYDCNLDYWANIENLIDRCLEDRKSAKQIETRKALIEKAEAYERGKMLMPDSEVEIDVFDGEVWLCDYSATREGAESIEKICDVDDIDLDEIRRICDDHNWSYCL